MLYLFGRLALSDSYYFQQEEEAFIYQQKMNGRRPEGPQPDPRAAVVDRRLHWDCQLPQASCAAAGCAN
ncbi:hypothetical protein [Hymenobacter sp. PAMC 26628]|uniref:hypothetical protein n=1 Tax=Hymenobacter sp. PAMC 26628 TaxID=1484118 RepID=UPI0007703F18|nr:hypothetical protein [Hymenobacter sp. PAMC 26628]AMJ66482.1 hypothetical protein AXW84_14365 [Hymenobacter sp. PAMC 26628]